MRACILLVDDNDYDQDLVVRIWRSHHTDIEIVRAGDGVEALDFVHGRGKFENRNLSIPFVIVLDLKMPRMDGFDVLRELKGHPRWRTVPIVIFTSSDQEVDVRRSYLLGANSYVVKPIEYSRFSVKVRELANYWKEINEPLVPASIGGEG